MPDETTQPIPAPAQIPVETQNSEENSIPVSPSEPTANAPIPPTESAPTDMSPQPLESPASPESAVPLNNDIPANEPLNSAPEPELTIDPNNPNITVEKHGNDVTITEVMEPNSAEATLDKPTAQMAGNEPLDLAEEIKTKKREENLKLANQTRQEKKRKKIDFFFLFFLYG